MSLLSMRNAYRIPNTRCTVTACRTNLPAKIFCTGYGFAQAAMLAEIWIDAVADRCGVSPEKVRNLNLRNENSETPLTCWNECLDKSSYHQRIAAARESNTQYTWKKKGFSIIPVMFPAGLIANSLIQASVLVHIYKDGWVLVTPAGNDMEQDTLNKMMQVASRELRVPISYIRIGENSTAVATDINILEQPCGGTVHAMAVQEACQTLLQRLQPIISLNPEATWRECIQEAFRHRICLSAANHYRLPDTISVSDWDQKKGTESPDFIFGAACSEVELDCRTGIHKILRTDIVIDVGSSISQNVTTEQVKRAYKQGLDLYTNEDFKYCLPASIKGSQSNQSEIVRSREVPLQIDVTLLPSSSNPYVACSPQAIEEVSTFLGSSVFFAIKDAALSARHHIGLPGTILLPIPVRPQDIRFACGNHLMGAEETLDKEELTLKSQVAET